MPKHKSPPPSPPASILHHQLNDPCRKARGALHAEMQAKLRKNEPEVKEIRRHIKRRVPGDIPPLHGAIERLRVGDPQDFFRLLPLMGPYLLSDREVFDLSIGRWFDDKDDPDPVVTKRTQGYLIRLGERLASVGSGRNPLAPELKRENRKRSTHKANNQRSQKETIARLMERIEQEEETLIQQGGQLNKTTRRRVFSTVITDWKETTRAKSPDAIVTKVKEIYFAK